MGTSEAAALHRLTYTGPGDSTLFLTVQTYCGRSNLPDEWQELIPEISAVVIDVLVLAFMLPLVEHTFNILLRKTRPSGLLWEDCGPQQPTTGTEIICEALASALPPRISPRLYSHQPYHQFTNTEWDGFGVPNLTYDSYIQASSRWAQTNYYKPLARHTMGTHPQAHAPMYGPTHHFWIHLGFGLIYMLLFWISAVMWWVEVGRVTATMQRPAYPRSGGINSRDPSYCRFALFVATPLIKPCLLALIAFTSCIDRMSVIMSHTRGPLLDPDNAGSFIPALLVFAFCIIGLPNTIFAWPMGIFHSPTLVATWFFGPVLLMVPFEIILYTLREGGWLVRKEDWPHRWICTGKRDNDAGYHHGMLLQIIWPFVLSIFFSLHYSKTYHSGGIPWLLHEQEFWSQVFKIPDLELAFSWPKRIPTHIQGVFGVELILYVTHSTLRWLEIVGKTVETVQEVTIQMTELQTRANDSETIVPAPGGATFAT